RSPVFVRDSVYLCTQSCVTANNIITKCHTSPSVKSSSVVAKERKPIMESNLVALIEAVQGVALQVYTKRMTASQYNTRPSQNRFAILGSVKKRMRMSKYTEFRIVT